MNMIVIKIRLSDKTNTAYLNLAQVISKRDDITEGDITFNNFVSSVFNKSPNFGLPFNGWKLYENYFPIPNLDLNGTKFLIGDYDSSMGTSSLIHFTYNNLIYNNDKTNEDSHFSLSESLPSISINDSISCYSGACADADGTHIIDFSHNIYENNYKRDLPLFV